MLALLIFRRAGRLIPVAPRARRIVAIAFLAIGLLGGGLLAWPMITYQPARVTLDGRIEGNGPILLSPSDWTGKPLPLLASQQQAAHRP